MRIKNIHILLFLLLVCVGGVFFQSQVRRAYVSLAQAVKGKKSISDRIAEYGDAVRDRLKPDFLKAGVVYPPDRVAILGFKEEHILEVWVAEKNGEWVHLKNYPILGMSGKLGPKLREGDRQVPEGIYHIESLHPNSRYHLALRLNYPNAEDQRRGQKDGRNDLGSDIMIHGKDCSIGCLAIGDGAAEDLFILAAETGIKNCMVILSPVDFRTRNLSSPMTNAPGWTGELYKTIRRELEHMKK